MVAERGAEIASRNWVLMVAESAIEFLLFFSFLTLESRKSVVRGLDGRAEVGGKGSLGRRHEVSVAELDAARTGHNGGWRKEEG